MSLPNVFQPQILSRVQPTTINKKRIFSNESKNMDQILGTNINIIKNNEKNDTLLAKQLSFLGKEDYKQYHQLRKNAKLLNGNNSHIESNDNIMINMDFRQPSVEKDFSMYQKHLKKNISRDKILDDKHEDILMNSEKSIYPFEDNSITINSEFRKLKTIDSDLKFPQILENESKMHEKKFLNTDLIKKINELQAKLNQEEKINIEWREKLDALEFNLKEVMNFIKIDKNNEDHNILSIHEKFKENQVAFEKEKDKIKVLFHEVTRLGHEQDQYEKLLQTLNHQVDTKLTSVESKLAFMEKKLNNVLAKTDSNVSQYQELTEKFTNKLQILQDNFHNPAKEQHLKDRDTINKRFELLDKKQDNELAQIFTDLQNDYLEKMESRILDNYKKIIKDFEEKVLKKYLIHVDELLVKKSKLGSEVKQKKDDSETIVKDIFEKQIKSLQYDLKSEELVRNLLETYMTEEIIRLEENIGKDLQFCKSTIAHSVERQTETIKTEIDTRIAAEIELRNNIAMITDNLKNEIKYLRDDLQKLDKKLGIEIKDTNLEFPNRYNQMNKYTDQQIAKFNDICSSKYEKLNGIIYKFGEQFKNHLYMTENLHQEAVHKINEIEKYLEENHSGSLNYYKENQKITHNRSQSIPIDLNLTTKIKIIEDRLQSFENEIRMNIGKLTETLNELKEFKQEKLEKEIADIYEWILKLENETSDGMKQIKEDFLDHVSHMIVKDTTERILRDNTLEEIIKDLQENIPNHEF